MKRLLAILLLVVTVPGGLHAAEEDISAAEKQEELEALRAEIREVQQALAEDIGKRDELTAKLRDTERALGQAANALREVNITLRFKQDHLQELEAEQRARRAALAAEREALAGQVRAAYMAGREEKLKLLLNQQDPATFGRVLAYYDYFNRARVERIERVNAQLERLDVLAGEIDHEVAELGRARAERADILAGLEETRDARGKLLAQLDTRIRDRNTELDQLRADERALSQLVESLLDVFADIPKQLADRAAFSRLRGKLPWPADGRVVARFGDPRADGRMQWNGLMIADDPGTPVRAVSHGRVAYADWMPHYGLLLVIEHGDGYLSLYGHNQSLYKEVGDWVEAGEIVAAIGDSGGRQNAALYFEIRHGKEIENPARWLAKQ